MYWELFTVFSSIALKLYTCIYIDCVLNLCTTGTSRKGRNKLRIYKTFKHEFKTEEYCKLILLPSHRSALCKFRWGVAPIRIETGRFENLKLDECKCLFCSAVEDELHVLLECNVYNDLRTSLFLKAVEIQPNFLLLSKTNQFFYSIIQSISDKVLCQNLPRYS